MKTISTLFTIALSILSTASYSQNRQDDIIATWKTQEADVEIYKVDDRYIGNPIDATGERNTDIEVLNLEFKNGKWIGKIYSHKRDKLIDVECDVEDEFLLLEVMGRFVSADLKWTKVN